MDQVPLKETPGDLPKIGTHLRSEAFKVLHTVEGVNQEGNVVLRVADTDYFLEGPVERFPEIMEDGEWKEISTEEFKKYLTTYPEDIHQQNIHELKLLYKEGVIYEQVELAPIPPKGEAEVLSPGGRFPVFIDFDESAMAGEAVLNPVKEGDKYLTATVGIHKDWIETASKLFPAVAAHFDEETHQIHPQAVGLMMSESHDDNKILKTFSSQEALQ